VLLTFARGMFRTAGVEFLPPFIAYGVPGLTSNRARESCATFRESCATFFPRCASFSP
jgi:hypothetical protein